MALLGSNFFDTLPLGAIAPGFQNGPDAGSNFVVQTTPDNPNTQSFGISCGGTPATNTDGATVVWKALGVVAGDVTSYGQTIYRTDANATEQSACNPTICGTLDATNLYVVIVLPTKSVMVYRRDGATSFTALADTVGNNNGALPNGATIPDGSLVSMRLERSGNLVRAKAWLGGADLEPDAWDCSSVDTTYMAGYLGFRVGCSRTVPTKPSIDKVLVGDLTGTTAILPGDALMFPSPYNWRQSGTAFLEANTPGAYIKFRCPGDTCKITLDPTAYGSYPDNQCPVLMAYVDGALNGSIQLQHGQTVQRLGNLGDGTHEITILFSGLYVFGDTWNGNAMRVVKVECSRGLSFTAPKVKAKRALVYGDSITKGESDMSPTGSGYSQNPVDSQASKSWAWVMFSALPDYEFGIVAYGGLGWEAASAGNVPRFDQSWSYYSNGNSRLVNGKLSPIPDLVVENHGANGTIASSDTVKNWIANFRAAVSPNTPVLLVQPFSLGRQNVPTIMAGFVAAADPNARLLDLGIDGTTAILSDAVDGVHPRAGGQATLAALVLARSGLATVIGAVSGAIGSHGWSRFWGR